MNLKDYIQGKRHGKEANELERKATNDAFLQDALDGFDAVQGEHLPVIEELEKRISNPKTQRNITPVWRWAVAALAFLLVGTSLLEIFNINNKNIPQTAVVVKPKVEIPEAKKDSVVVADNIHQKTVEKASVHYKKQPQQINNDELRNEVKPVSESEESEDETTVIAYRSDKELKSNYSLAPSSKNEFSLENHIDSSNSLNGYVSQASKAWGTNNDIGKIAGVEIKNFRDINPANDSIKIKYNEILQGKVAGISTKSSNLYGSKKHAFDNIKVRGTASNTTNPPIRLTKGRLLDENGEPLAGANVIVKGTKNGVVTNINGEFTLPLVNVKKDSMLTASYLGMQSKEIPIKDNIGEIKLLADNRVLNEVVVTGYGVQKRSNVTGSISTISSRKYVFYKKQFINYFKQNYDKNICSNQKIKVKVCFNLNENGHPENIQIIRTNCSEMEGEIKKWLEKSPNWTIKNKSVTLKFSVKQNNVKH